MVSFILALCVAGHGPLSDDPLAPPRPAPVPPAPIPQVERIVIEDESAHDEERERERERRSALGAARVAMLLRHAKPGEKNVVLAFATPRCRPCGALLAWFDDPIVKRALAADFAVISVDHDDEDGYAMCFAYAGVDGCEGWPVVVVVDAKGNRLAPAALGYPDTRDEAAAFIAMLARGAPHLDAATRDEMARRLFARRPR